MKTTKLASIGLGLLICLTPAIITTTAFVVGCSTVTTQEAKTYNSFRDAWAVTHAAYQSWCERAVQGKVTSEQEIQADKAWNAYRATFRAAFVAASQNWNAPVPPEIKTLSTQTTAMLKSN